MLLTFIATVSCALLQFFSLYLEEHHYSRSTIGLLWSLGVLAEVIAFTQTHRLLAKVFRVTTDYRLFVISSTTLVGDCAGGG